MVHLWAVIGDSNMRKTSSIRALTGVGRTQPNWEISYLADGKQETYVHPAGLQEVDISPQEFIDSLNDVGVDKVIVALRHDPARGHGGAIEYLEEFTAAGWVVAGNAVLGRDEAFPNFGKKIALPNAATTPANEIANRLRRKWGIL